MELIHKLLWILKPEGIQWLITTGGLPAICLIIFAETGFFAILPGDSLLVLCGILAVPGAGGRALIGIWPLLLLVPLFAIAGDQVGFWIGSWFGNKMYAWQDRAILGIPVFKQAWLKRTHDFYERWGVFFIVMGRWVPIVRTFAPIVAGITRMRFATFITFNAIGGISWIWSMVLAGYFLGGWVSRTFQFDLARHIDKIALVVVLISVLPIAWTIYRERREDSKVLPDTRP